MNIAQAQGAFEAGADLVVNRVKGIAYPPDKHVPTRWRELAKDLRSLANIAETAADIMDRDGT